MRAQAVSNLVRELERETGASARIEAKAVAPPRAATSSQKADFALPAAVIAPANPPLPAEVVCDACGNENPRGQKFCGMCGHRLVAASALTANAAKSNSTREENLAGNKVAESRPAWVPVEQLPHWIAESESDPSEPATEADEAIVGQSYEGQYESEAGEYESGEWNYSSTLTDDDLPHFAREQESVPYRYRLYVGVVIAIMLAGLIYLARNENGIFSSGSPASRNIPAAQNSNAPPEPAATPAPPPVEKVEKDEAPPAKTVKPASNAERIPPEEAASARPTARPRSLNARAATAPSHANAPPNAGGGPYGLEENAEAQKYLNQRNPAEAAQWLWKAVAKGNAAATVTLADLYLHGNGVPKNCDQGRLLLDIGAKKGVHGAAERLRNLQAFGCR